MTYEIIPYSDVERIGAVLAKSKLFGMKTPEEAIALCLIAQAEGKHPATAAQEYHVIQGRPALKADAMLARFQNAGGKVEWKAYTDEEVSGIFSHPQGGSVTITWNVKMAKDLGFLAKDNWKKYPRAMMRARCISEGVRTVYPGIAVGIYTPEEVQDFEKGGEVIEGTFARSPFKTAADRNRFCKNAVDAFANAMTLDELKEIAELNHARMEEMKASGDERDALAVEEMRKQYGINKKRIESEPLSVDAELAAREAAFAEGGEYDEIKY